jgi:glycine/D-amino acid oxidase-like deaminating enzyme
VDLSSGTPYWPLRNGLLATYPPLDRHLDCTVAIMGAGITGALAAWHLAEAGVDCVVLDSRDVATGSTAASTALLQYEIDVPMHQLAAMVGEPDAVRAYRICLQALRDIAALDHRLGGGHGFRQTESLQGASRKSHTTRLKREYELRQRHGFDVELWDQRRVHQASSLPYPSALISRDAAQIDAHRFTCSLLADAARRGACIHDRTRVTRRKSTRSGFTLETDRGHRVHAKHLVLATGYEADPLLPSRLTQLLSTYALVTEPAACPPGWPGSRLIWETARPYVYLRLTDDGRALIGGYDEPFRDPKKRDALLSRKTTALTRRFHQLFPEAPCEVGYAWCGTFAETPDGLPCIGRHPRHTNMYYALGYGGNGITYSLVAAQMIREFVHGKVPAHADLFDLNRHSLK